MLMYLLTPVIAAVALVTRNYIPPAAVAGGLTVTALVVLNSKYNDVFPWSIPATYVLWVKENGFVTDSTLPVILTMVGIEVGVYVVGSIFNLLYLRRADVH